MTRRNRKKRRHDGYMSRATPFAGLVLLLVILGIGYAGLDFSCKALGRDIQKLERAQEDLAKRCRNEEGKWNQTKSQPNLRAALAKHGIAMAWPSGGQIIRMKDAEVYGERWDALTGETRQFAHLERSRGHE